jgi:hypothetical protein
MTHLPLKAGRGDWGETVSSPISPKSGLGGVSGLRLGGKSKWGK